METISINLYTFDELIEKAQNKVLDDNRYFNVEHDDWHEYTIEDEKTKLAELGYLDADISFSGFHSQGDGASFTAKIDLDAWINQDKTSREKFLSLNQYDISAWIDKSASRYHHEETMSACTDMDCDAPETMLDLEDELQVTIEAEAKELAGDIYNQLRKEYEYLTSDEAIKESITINEYTFEADGTMRNV